MVAHFLAILSNIAEVEDTVKFTTSDIQYLMFTSIKIRTLEFTSRCSTCNMDSAISKKLWFESKRWIYVI
jgi:hypothetical protein